MAGAEAIAAISLAAACITIIDKITSIGDAVHDAQGLPSKLRLVFEKLPVIEELLNKARESFENENISEATSERAQPVLEQCKQALEKLRNIFQDACPEDEENRRKRLWKGAKTVFFGRDSKVKGLLLVIQDSLQLLEQMEICTIGDKLSELRELTEALGPDDSSKYTHSGEGHIIANEAGSPTNYVLGGRYNRQVNNPGVYHEGPATHTHHHAAPARPETPPEPSSNIPFRLDPEFVERPAITDQLSAKLSVLAARVALVGLGGVGKSSLAISFARELMRRSPQTWVLWIHASSLTRFEASIRDTADLLKIPGRESAQRSELLIPLRNRLRDKRRGRWLIVLDSADDVEYLVTPLQTSDANQSVPRRIDVVPACDHGCVLVTTRSMDEALKLVHESDSITVSPMSEDESETLLNHKLGQPNPGSRTLARSLDCMPLAIIQAAALIRKRGSRCSVQKYGEDIERNRASRRGLLQREVQNLGRDFEASNSILLTWQTSFEYLKRIRQSAADLLSLMSFCDRTSIPYLLINTKCDQIRSSSSSGTVDFDEDIDALQSLSLISVVAHGQAWEMHRLVQDATQMWLEDNSAIGKAHGRFVHCLIHAVPGDEAEHWAVCRTLYPHAKSALQQKPCDENVLLEWATAMADFAWYAARSQTENRDLLAMAIASMDVRSSMLGPSDLLTLESSHIVALAHMILEQFSQAEELAKAVLEARRKRLGSKHIDTLQTEQTLAMVYLHQGRYTEAEKLLRTTLEIERGNCGEKEPLTCLSEFQLAFALYMKGRRSDATEMFERILDTYRAKRPEDPVTLHVMHSVATIHQGQGRWREANALFVEAIKAQNRIYGPEHLYRLMGLTDLCSAFIDQARWQAELLGKEVSTSFQEIFDDEHNDTWECIQSRGQEVEPIRRDFVQICKELLGEEHSTTLRSMRNLALSWTHSNSSGKVADGEGLLRRVVEVNTRVQGADHSETLDSQSALALSFSQRGRLEDAEKLQSEVLEMSIAKLGADHPETLGKMVCLATTYTKTGRLEEAVALQTKAVDGYTRFATSECEMHMPMRLPEQLLLQYRQMLELQRAVEISKQQSAASETARTYAAQGRLDEAVELLEKAEHLLHTRFNASEGSVHQITREAEQHLAEYRQLLEERQALEQERRQAIEDMQALEQQRATETASELPLRRSKRLKRSDT